MLTLASTGEGRVSASAWFVAMDESAQSSDDCVFRPIVTVDSDRDCQTVMINRN